MKVAPKLIFLFKDADGFGTSISDSLQPNPNSTTLRRLEDSFQLSLERYGIRDRKASGNIVHFVDHDGHYQVTLLLMQNYEPPVLVCAISEVLASINGESSSIIPTVVLPIIVATPNLKLERKYSTTSDKVSLYGVQIGPETDITQDMVAKTQKPPSSLQIHHEPLACFLQLVHVLKLPTFVLIGQSGQRKFQKGLGEELEMIYEIGELLTSISSLCFLRERITWNPTKTSKEVEEPWRALYG
ncbi:hypothetical protein LOK49_LG07G02786 [Camellia lanceoleosa]|uniref:Uncharacterized protein n=1 Tax=Camellia lanceoleosa TaxID=1840588 RepID=A0ACC0H4W7_9ERIC|nr:hypothetical protein LOK49_LG07G02786 [Camellia lanceoleosa]